MWTDSLVRQATNSVTTADLPLVSQFQQKKHCSLPWLVLDFPQHQGHRVPLLVHVKFYVVKGRPSELTSQRGKLFIFKLQGDLFWSFDTLLVQRGNTVNFSIVPSGPCLWTISSPFDPMQPRAQHQPTYGYSSTIRIRRCACQRLAWANPSAASLTLVSCNIHSQNHWSYAIVTNSRRKGVR